MVKYRQHLLLTFFSLCASSLFAQVDTTQQIVAHRENSKAQMTKPYVILISADGFRYDYAQKYEAKHLLHYAQDGISADAMLPSFPSLTFPNHYALITGLYPSHSGLASNQFYDTKRKEFYSMSKREVVRDGSWYGGTPLWVLAEQQQMLSASFYWVGSEAPIKNTPPTYFYYYNELIPDSSRIQTVKKWLSLPEAQRPHFISFYFPEVDHEGHHFGPEAPETGKAVRYVDQQIDALVKAVKETGLPVNFIFVADHGMTAIDREHPIQTPAAIDTVKFNVVYSGTMINLYAKDPTAIISTYKALKETATHYQVYLKKEIPASLHYGAADDRFNRIGDIVLLSNWPQLFSDRTPYMGAHGFNSLTVKDMGAVFMAWGPAFKKGYHLGTFPNVDVYPLVAKILGLNITEPIDGDDLLWKQVLK